MEAGYGADTAAPMWEMNSMSESTVLQLLVSQKSLEVPRMGWCFRLFFMNSIVTFLFSMDGCPAIYMHLQRSRCIWKNNWRLPSVVHDVLFSVV